MRTYGRVNGKWVEVDSDASGNDDEVWITTLAQCLKLSPNESPFFANYGIPAQQSIVTQVFPDYYVALMQGLFAKYFASLSVSKVAYSATANPATPTYNVNVVTNSGVIINHKIAV